MDWNFANLQAGVYSSSLGTKQSRTAKDFLLQFDSEKEQSDKEFWGAMHLFAAKHNSLVKRK